MSADSESNPRRETESRRSRRGMSLRARRFMRAVSHRFSSSLTRRIVVLNLGGLVALLLGFLYLNQFREGLIEARVESLTTQGEIMAAAIAASANVDTDAITLDPEKLLQLAPGETLGAIEDGATSFEFSINPERVGPVLRRLVLPTRTRARVFDRDGYMLLDSRFLTSRGNIIRFDLPASPPEQQAWHERLWSALRQQFAAGDPILADDPSGDGREIPEVASALTGVKRSAVRVNARGQTIVSVAVPVQRFRVVRGALLLSTQGGDIDKIIASERWAILRVFLVSAAVMLVLSLFLAGTIAEPMRRLAEAADRVRRGVRSRQEIPDFTDRADEIGHLSGALRDMTRSLYNRIEAIESFAADVSHELKNPLTSLRSAVETLPRVKKDEQRARLLEIIQHDVKRLDRLITDISDASRLDAELARSDLQPLDLATLAQAIAGGANQIERGDGVRVAFTAIPGDTPRDKAFRVMGNDLRLGQVITNLVDNARSFSPQGGEVRVILRRARPPGARNATVELCVEDDGPGVPAHAFERIFERFYTDRPTQTFGQNSGLGLSISRQIVEAHGGTIEAENRRADGQPHSGLSPDDEGYEPVAGARFIVRLKAAA